MGNTGQGLSIIKNGLDLSFLNAPAVLKSVIIAVFMGVMYFSALKWLVLHDWPRGDYNYAYIIPLVVLYMLWEKRGEFISARTERTWLGLMLIVPGLALFVIGEMAGEFYSVYLSSWIILVGIIWMLIGWRKLKIIAFPLFIILSAFPPPHFINDRLTFYLKLVSSMIGVKLLQIYGIPAYREGNVIDLGFTQLQVVDACSGLRYLFPLIILALILSYYYRAAIWKKILLVASAVPLSLATNSMRIALTGILHQSWGPEVAEEFFHGFSGWIIFAFSLAVLLAEMWLLEKVFSEPVGKPVREASPNISPERSARFEIGELLRPPQYIAVLTILAVSVAAANYLDVREKTPAKKSLSGFPGSIAEWTGHRQYMGQDFIKELDLSDYVMVNYGNSSGREIHFYLAYYESQKKGESIHSPETCLPGGGWEYQQSGRANLKGPRGDISVNRAVLMKGGKKQVVYFWFPMRGRNLTGIFELKLYTFWDALVKRRTDGSLVRINTLVYPSEVVEDADARLQAFAKGILPLLDEYLPGT